jgi:hypothetical protein
MSILTLRGRGTYLSGIEQNEPGLWIKAKKQKGRKTKDRFPYIHARWTQEHKINSFTSSF